VRDLHGAVAKIAELRECENVHVGVCPRTRQEGTAAAVERAFSLWADCDTDEAVERLQRFRPPPSIVVRSGSANHLHAYWPLRQPLSSEWVQRANRRLSTALSSDDVGDAPRCLRPVGSLNHKSRSPVLCVRLELDVFTFSEVVGGLADDERYTRPSLPTGSRIPITGATLDGLVRIVREAAPGGRNDALNWSAYKAGEHVAAGELDAETVRSALLDAALAVDLSETEALRTIDSALGAAGRCKA
jgi:hypothetical protein